GFRYLAFYRRAGLLEPLRRVALHARCLGPRWRFRLSGAVVEAAGRDREITVRRDVQEMQPRARAVVRAAAIAEHVNAELRVTETREVRRAVHDVVRQPRVDLLHWRKRTGAGSVRNRVLVLRGLRRRDVRGAHDHCSDYRGYSVRAHGDLRMTAEVLACFASGMLPPIPNAVSR